jgi:hypothetical protein
VNFFVMKHMQGPSLSDLVDEDGKLEAREVERVLMEVSDALDHAHQRGVVHRDVKPDNIMRDQTGRYVVMDFGIAKSIGGTQLTQTGGSIGTPKYMSPEQAKGAELDGRSDFYSLGVVAYHCLIGRPPFDAEDTLAVLYSHLHDPVPEPPLSSEAERRIFAVIRRLLAKSPAERPTTGAEVRKALSGQLAPAWPGPPPARSRGSLERAIQWARSRPRRQWIPAASAFAFVTFAIARESAADRCRAAMPDFSDGDRAVVIEPPGSIERGSEIELAYVVCGLEGDETFATRVTISPADGGGVVGRVGRLFGGGRDAFRESWDDEADGFATARTRAITPGDLQPGAYRISIDVESSSGGDPDASHEFTVVEP